MDHLNANCQRHETKAPEGAGLCSQSTRCSLDLLGASNRPGLGSKEGEVHKDNVPFAHTFISFGGDKDLCMKFNDAIGLFYASFIQPSIPLP